MPVVINPKFWQESLKITFFCRRMSKLFTQRPFMVVYLDWLLKCFLARKKIYLCWRETSISLCLDAIGPDCRLKLTLRPIASRCAHEVVVVRPFLVMLADARTKLLLCVLLFIEQSLPIELI